MRTLQRFAEWDAASSRRLSLAGRPGLLRSLAVFFAHSGDSWFWLAGLGLVWVVGNSFWKERALLYGASLLITAGLVLGIKFSIRRQRPEGDWGAVYRKTDPHSFPSGHAVRAVLLAVLALGTGPVWLGVLLAIWAPLVILARVAMGVHYLSDVLAGALFGALVGILILVIAPAG
jgi:undecaprenyl-diphosphatase